MMKGKKHPKIANFSINSCNWSYSKLSLEKLQLNLLVPIFLWEKFMSKKKKKKTNANKINCVKTVENILYEPILS